MESFQYQLVEFTISLGQVETGFKMTNMHNEMLHFLLSNYKKVLLTPKEAAQATGRSIQSLQRDRLDGVGMEYKKSTDANNAKVYYPITSVVEYMTKDLVVTK